MICNTVNPKKISYYLMGMLIFMYLIGNTTLVVFIDQSLLNYWIIPLIWLTLILLMRFKIPHAHGLTKLKYKPTVWMWAFNCGVAWIGVNLIAGFVEGFGKSPYSHSPRGIFNNFMFIGLALIGREFVRAYIVNAHGKRNINKTIIAVVILMTLTDINISRLFDIRSLKELTIFGAEQLLPALASNILGTHLVAYGGASASLIYLGMVEAFEWLSPILPNVDWLAKGVIGMAVPLVCLMVLTGAYDKMTKVVKPYKIKEESLWQWIPTGILCVLLVWFTVGVFPVYPSAIATGSMQPMIDPGDVVLVRKMQSQEDIEALQIDDVIQFKRGDILINHRIIDIIEEDNGLKLYQTKGDNNSAIDGQLVKMEDVKGIIVGVIPKVGWPTLIFKNEDPDILKEVEF